MLEQLEPYAPALQALGSSERFSLSFTFVYPSDIFYNASGKLSSRTIDLSNCEKHVQDMLFGVMGANDKYVTELYSTKRAGAQYEIHIEIKTPGIAVAEAPAAS